MFLKTLRIKTEQQATAAHVFFLFFLIMSWPEFAWLQFLPHPILVLSSGLKPFPDFIYFTGKKWQHNLLAMPANHTTQRKRTCVHPKHDSFQWLWNISNNESGGNVNVLLRIN